MSKSTTTLPATEDGSPAGKPQSGHQREEAIRTSVLATLGRPGDLYRVAVMPVWGDHFRVNVLIGEGPASVRIPHSYFVAADARGNILESTPVLKKHY